MTPSRPSPLRLLLVLLAVVSAAGCRRDLARDRLLIAYPVTPLSLELGDASHEEFSMSVLANVYEPLVEVDPEGLALRPVLAESWHNPDELTWVFELRAGVRLHDGRTLTAADVARSYARLEHDAWMQGELGPITGVEARSEREVVIRTRRRFPSLPARLVYFLIQGQPGAAGAPLAGTGPYRVREWTPGTRTVLEAFADHRGGAPAIRQVEFRAVPDPAERARLLRRGELHLITDVRPEDMALLGATPGIRTLARPGLRVLFLGMDCAHATSPSVSPPGNPFRERRVREAVALAVDKPALVAGPLQGLAEPVDQLATPAEVGYDPSLRQRPANLEQARRRLAEAGLAQGFAVDLDYMPGKYLAIDAVAQAIAAQLARIGIRVTPRAHEARDLLARIEARNTSFYLLGWLNDTGSAQETYESLLHTPHPDGGATNGGGYSNPDLDTLLEEASAEPEHRLRADLLRRATALIDADVPVVPLYRQKDLYASSDALEFEPGLVRRVAVARLRWKAGR